MSSSSECSSNESDEEKYFVTEIGMMLELKDHFDDIISLTVYDYLIDECDNCYNNTIVYKCQQHMCNHKTCRRCKEICLKCFKMACCNVIKNYTCNECVLECYECLDIFEEKTCIVSCVSCYNYICKSCYNLCVSNRWQNNCDYCSGYVCNDITHQCGCYKPYRQSCSQTCFNCNEFICSPCIFYKDNEPYCKICFNLNTK